MTFKGDCKCNTYNKLKEISYYLSNLQSQPPNLEGWGGLALKTATKYFIDSSEEDKEHIEFTGKVQYMNLEGGFWSILSSESNFIPINIQNALFSYNGQTVKIKGFINQNVISSVYKWGTLIFVDVIMIHDKNELSPYCKNILNTPILPLPDEEVLLDVNIYHNSSRLPLYYSWSFVYGDYIQSPDKYILIQGYSQNNKSINTSFSSFPVNIMLETQNEKGQITRVYKNIYQNISLEPEHEESPTSIKTENIENNTLKKYYDEIFYIYTNNSPKMENIINKNYFCVDQ